MAEQRETPLLKETENYYYENCPGCKVDRRKAQDPNPPYIHFSFIFAVALASGTHPPSLSPSPLFLLLKDSIPYHIFHKSAGNFTSTVIDTCFEYGDVKMGT